MNHTIPADESAPVGSEPVTTTTNHTPAPAPSRSAATTPTATRDEQRAYLLQQVMEAPEHQLAKGKANRFPRAVARELCLTPTLANELRDDLVREGNLRTEKKSGSVVYELTERGKALLPTLPQKQMPESRKPARDLPVSQEVQLARKTFLLFQLFEADKQTLDQKEANRFREPGRKFLELRAGTANRLRKEMAEQGLLTIQRDSRNATYTLTDRGIEFLGVSGVFAETEFTMNGKVLNQLLESARESAKQFEEPEVREPMEMGEPATVG